MKADDLATQYAVHVSRFVIVSLGDLASGQSRILRALCKVKCLDDSAGSEDRGLVNGPRVSWKRSVTQHTKRRRKTLAHHHAHTCVVVFPLA
jgi:hypothetical protein